ncbi:MAG: three-Cys-motif partner protein TcmP [Deltaproteobacteria bacterium]|nr:three-Cys-motif partner protein TcmP [Deltaproteobacteria bacterium]
MDKKGFIQEHSKIKLELYRLYLERYLSVLLTTPFFEKIVINDLFAGCGIALNEEKGSAFIAAETIERIKAERNPRNKEIILNLNDANQASCVALQKHLHNRPFVYITNQDANRYIHSYRATQKSHNLFFIDPHGYTQVSIENLKRLFTMERSDFLIFIPIYHLFRFKEVVAAQTKPVSEFLKALGINDDDIVRADDVNKFADLIVESLRNISITQWVYKHIIENRIYNSSYCLFFITHNIRGAEKFLEAKHELEKEIKSKERQLSFDFVADLNRKSILYFIEYEKSYDNIALYELGIIYGFLPKDINQELTKLEHDNKIEICEFPNKKRQRKGFYINYDHHTRGDRIISITFKR